MLELLKIVGTAVIVTIAVTITILGMILWTSHAYRAGVAYAEYECEFENSSQVN